MTGSAALLQLDIVSKEYCNEYINRVNLFHWFEEIICSTEKVKDSWNKPISKLANKKTLLFFGEVAHTYYKD